MASTKADEGTASTVERFPRVMALLSGLVFVAVGGWAMADPRSFFDALAAFEPYNKHFIQDIGAFQIGLGAVLLLAAARERVDGLAVALLGVGVGSAFHAVSHVVGRDLGGTPETDIPTFGILAVLLLVAGVIRARRPRVESA